MVYLALIIFAFLLFQLFNVLLNLLFLQRITGMGRTISGIRISILVPARNEEENIGCLLESLRDISELVHEIVVYNDFSEDNTEAVVQQHAGICSKIHLIGPTELPVGWLGKNHACYQLSQKATGDYWLFIDADVKLEKGLIEDAVSFMGSRKLTLLSFFPIQQQVTFGEKASVPIMNYILLTLLPLIFVRMSPFSSHSAANGQFMLFKADDYKRIQPHCLFRSAFVEDIAIARYYKKNMFKIACITGDTRVKCRMYRSYNESLNGFAKNIFMFFGNQPVLALLFWVFTSFGVVLAAAVSLRFFLTFLVAMILIQLGVAIIGKQNPFYSILLLPIHIFFLIHVIYKSFLTRRSKGLLWKGRNIYT